VLKWFEEHRIPVDYIAGTSMGGLVGGLFASGRDSAEMVEFVDSIDWVDVLRGAPAYSELSFRRKEDQRTYPNQIEMGFKKGVRLPAGLNAGHKVGLLLDEIAFPYSALHSFDDLPTPFRCVAADLLSAQPVVFSSGSLSRALRATMSIPGVFEPVRDQDMLLVDGGILNNLPVDVVKEMGAGLVIAVDLGYPQPKAEEITSVLGVIGRSLDVMIQANVSRNVKLADIVLRPDLKGYDTYSFEATTEIIKRGYQQAEAQAQVLLPLALDEPSWEEYRHNRESRRREFKSQPQFAKTEGLAPLDEPSADKLLKRQVGIPLNVKMLNAALTKITGWGRYEGAGYTKEVKDGVEGLDVEVKSKSYGPPFFKPFLEINGNGIDDIKFTLGGRLTFYDVLRSNAEWRTDLSLGFRNVAATELYRPIGQTGFFVAPRAYASRVDQNIYFNGDRVATYVTSETGVGIDLGYALGQTSEIRFGYDLGQEKGHAGIGDPRIPSFSGRVNSLTGKWQIDRLDDPVIPTRGLRMRVQGWWYLDTPGSNPPFPQVETRTLFAHPFTPRLSALVSIQGGTSFEKNAPFTQKFILGGPLQLGALGFQELRGNHYFYGSAGLLRTLSEKPATVFGKISAIAYYEVGDAFDSKANAFNDVSAGILSGTKLGVLFFGGSVGESGHYKIYFSLGRFF
jgi:NTE family protein